MRYEKNVVHRWRDKQDRYGIRLSELASAVSLRCAEVKARGAAGAQHASSQFISKYIQRPPLRCVNRSSVDGDVTSRSQRLAGIAACG